MSLDFDSGALQTQHEDEDYDQEDYAREQELQQLLTDLPHDMLEDSGDQLSSYSDCSIHETEEQSHESGKHDGRWNDHPLISDPQNGYEQGQNLYPEQFLCDQQNDCVEKHGKNWNGLHNDEEKQHLYDVKDDYCGQNGQEDPDDVYLGRDGFNAPSCYQQNNVYHLPENFRPYTNGHKPEFNNLQSKIINFPDAPKEHLKQFVASDVVSGQSPESYKVTYKPYQNGIHQKIPVIQEGTRKNEVFEDLQHEFLGNDDNSSESMQILQLQVLNKARERQLEELNEKLEKSAQQIRYLNHQLSMVKDEKDGLAVSLHESQKLYQNGKEREVHLEGQIKALETQIQTLTTNEEQILKQSKVAEVAMESMQKQLLELQRSDALQRAREQHEAIISALKQKYEKQVLSLEQKLDTTKSALREQKELCKNLGDYVKQLEKMLEETKCEKTEIINRLTRSLEESQKQCANLLQTGSMQETNQLRFQLQQAQSAHMISNNMNKALQEELMELKEEIALYESAAKLGVFLNDVGGELHTNLGDSYVDLGIKKIAGKKPRFCSAIQNRDMDEELSKDEIIVELKAELERLLSSNKMKRNQITQLQNDLKDCQKTLEEYKQLLKAEKASKESEPVANPNDKLAASPLVSDNLKEEVLRLRKANETLLQEVENRTSTIEELKESEEKLKSLNQDLCCQMRKMVQDFDQDKQEAIDRCERTYQQHHEDTKAHFEKDLMERYAAEKQQLIQTYEETISQLKANIDELSREMTAVKECYIGVCGEKDTLEATLRQKFEQEQQLKEEKLKKQLLEEKEDSLNLLRTELEEKHSSSMIAAKRQWLEEKEQQVEEEVALAKVHWEKEEKENKEQVFAEIQRQWQSRLEETRRTVVECHDCSSQTDRVTVVDEASTKELEGIVGVQRLQIQKALKENMASEEALKEFEIELENKYRKNLASQVDAALTQAHARWLQELTDLKEYKVNLKIEQEKWEKEHKETAAKQLALVLSAAEEKWKKEYENTEKSGPRMKELEEKVISLKKELELKKEEIPAAIKAELAKARAQWNKEKQEEILQIQEQNERDYRSFLDDHRNRIKEVLATAKEDLAKQKNDLSIQKQAEIKMLLDQKQREWEAQETKRLKDEINRYEEKTLLALEYLLSEIHEELVKCTHSKHSWKDKCFDARVQLNHQCKDKLKACLQKAYRTTVHTILEKKEQEWKEKYEELVSNVNKEAYSCLQHGEGETGDVTRPPVYNVGHQAEAQGRLRRQPPLQETGTDKENEKVLQALIAENSEMKTKLKDLGTPPRSLSKGGVSKPCTSCDSVKGLEEMRAQYIKAVSKIKCDMLCYIRESKERAAEMIKVEVLRERQETARKMRKYYLTCLQQLLTDNGKHEGAEKKIMNAASKLAMMVKGLETPLRHIPQSKSTCSALLLNSDLPPGVEYSKRDCMLQTRSNCMESKSCSESITKKANDKVAQKGVPHDLRQQFDAMQTETQHMLHETVTSNIQNGNNSKNLDGASRDALPEFYPNENGRREKYSPIINADKGLVCATSTIAHQNASPSAFQVTTENMHAPSFTNGHAISGPTHHMLKSKNDRTVLKEDKCVQSCGKWKAKSKRTQEFDFQESPERDEGSSSEWSSVNGSLHLDCSDTPLVNLEQKAGTNVQAQTAYCEEFPHIRSFSPADENVVTTWRDTSNGNGKILSTESSTEVCSRGHLITNPEHTSFLNSDKSNSAVTQFNVLPDSNVGKCCNKCLEKNSVGSPVSSAR
ncbi:PREDICTED: centrosomal protein of 152 kDa isoform X3 [Haliaeetus leucocephalus]|uniref:centrosomal protein of 152 kDa isoform X3 n=1 Tax=Haliaeetus leucocephalus TaxID=52644 RepID=UPI00053CC26E|nr:PREDICTED: centrosomal protein of 152 kDa isoform X3 [Haliaeetus leucocephalus]